ncbi:hypothetical protein NE848_08755 [Gramella jeungdoensis]|uniref:Uncharacterized protein n=1 Tax=Gramella jeungdoensis TaxID=708091 RepID=A0ABT0Z164_9FLAO|nr:hypothetical protein [Gramella jeungdoensis]MCM8569467.1 hypothetical protein [Gramella jeungdoensis]
MRTSIIAIILMIFTANDCKQSEQTSITYISYETFTRGSSTIYKVSPDSLEIKSSGLNSSESSMNLKVNQWSELLEKLEGVEVSKISQLKAPSDARASDAAPHAILSIRKNDTIYKTNSFDHGNAPTTIKPLIEAILRLAENVE